MIRFRESPNTSGLNNTEAYFSSPQVGSHHFWVSGIQAPLIDLMEYDWKEEMLAKEECDVLSAFTAPQLPSRAINLALGLVKGLWYNYPQTL